MRIQSIEYSSGLNPHRREMRDEVKLVLDGDGTDTRALAEQAQRLMSAEHVGLVTAEQARHASCGHVRGMPFDFKLGAAGRYECAECGFTLDAWKVDRPVPTPTGPDAERQRALKLADECQKLRDENTELLAENARLRRGR